MKKRNKIYDAVIKILEDNPLTRNSDKLLYWKILEEAGLIYDYPGGGTITFKKFMRAPSYESISRARRKIQELNPWLRATDPTVQKARKQKQKTKGTFIYREEI